MTRRDACNSIRYGQGTKVFLGLALLGSTIAWAADTVPLDVKTGEWEYTVTTQMTGMPQSAQQMPTIPPSNSPKYRPSSAPRLKPL